MKELTRSDRRDAGGEIPPGLSMPSAVVARLEGTRIRDADGRASVDFAAGRGCHNAATGFPPRSLQYERLDRYLRQSFLVAVQVCRDRASCQPGR